MCVSTFALFSIVVKASENQVVMETARQVQANHERLIPIIKIFVLCARQGLSLRGHRDTGMFDINKESEENEGNFRALLRTSINSGNEHLKNIFKFVMLMQIHKLEDTK